jgi:hypothetical protein
MDVETRGEAPTDSEMGVAFLSRRQYRTIVVSAEVCKRAST